MFFGIIRGGHKSLRDILADHHYPAANTAATKTITAIAKKTHSIHKIYCSYDADPTGGQIKIESPVGTVVFKQSITHSGPCVFSFSPRVSAENEAPVITLAAGGSGITGTLDFEYTTEHD